MVGNQSLAVFVLHSALRGRARLLPPFSDIRFFNCSHLSPAPGSALVQPALALRRPGPSHIRRCVCIRLHPVIIIPRFRLSVHDSTRFRQNDTILKTGAAHTEHLKRSENVSNRRSKSRYSLKGRCRIFSEEFSIRPWRQVEERRR